MSPERIVWTLMLAAVAAAATFIARTWRTETRTAWAALDLARRRAFDAADSALRAEWDLYRVLRAAEDGRLRVDRDGEGVLRARIRRREGDELLVLATVRDERSGTAAVQPASFGGGPRDAEGRAVEPEKEEP